MIRRIAHLAVLALLAGGAVMAEARESVGFGYLANRSDDINYNYLETIFPNSFANSIRNIFEVNVLKPHAITEILGKKNLALKKEYDPWELPELLDEIRTGIFIYGTFTPLPGNRIKIVLNLYSDRTKRLFTFTNIGKMETEIFKLVDRITVILVNYLENNQLFQSMTMKEKKRVALISGLTGNELNQLYAPFMEQGYSVKAVQANTVNSIMDDTSTGAFEYIYTRDNAYDIITDMRAVKFLYGSWGGPRYQENLEKLKSIYGKYDFNYRNTKEDALERLSAAYGDTIDYLIFIGFNRRKTGAWVRCIDMKDKTMIFMQHEIEGKSIGDVGAAVIRQLTTPIKNPLAGK